MISSHDIQEKGGSQTIPPVSVQLTLLGMMKYGKPQQYLHLQKCRVLVPRLPLIILHRGVVEEEGGGWRQNVCQDATAMVILYQFISSYKR